MDRPLIAIVGYRLDAGRVSRWPWAGFAVPVQYADAVGRAGGQPVVLPPGVVRIVSDADADDTVDAFDGLVLAGGGDIEPRRYGAVDHPAQYGVDPVRDEIEMALALAARRRRVPLLAICRGAQILNVALGGTLHQHVPDLPGTGLHGVPGGGPESTQHIRLVPGSRTATAAGATELEASCHHHQAIDRLGDGLVAAGWASDGLVEAIEPDVTRPGEPDGPDWVLGVQWHPEDTAARDPAQQRLFDAMVARAATRRRSAPEPEARTTSQPAGAPA
jgi:putative glutamine amidotransferase